MHGPLPGNVVPDMTVGQRLGFAIMRDLRSLEAGNSAGSHLSPRACGVYATRILWAEPGVIRLEGSGSACVAVADLSSPPLCHPEAPDAILPRRVGLGIVTLMCEFCVCAARGLAAGKDGRAARLGAAKTELRYYWQVEYPQQMPRTGCRDRMTRAEIENNRGLLREYQPFTRFAMASRFRSRFEICELCIRSR